MAFDSYTSVVGTSGDDLARQNYFRRYGYDANQRDAYESKFRSAADEFAGQFKQLVGRLPTTEETSSYMGQIVGGSGAEAFGANRGLELSQLTSNFIGSRYADEADRIATERLQAQQGEAQRLSDLFRTQGNQAINSTEQSLLDYQNKLFERLRPQLLTSLQSQGLLNTGGLNQAIAGAQGDLATAGSEELRQLRFANEQGANQIAFSGQAAPYEFQQQQIMNRPAQLQAAAGTGLQNAYNTFTNQLNFQNQAALNQQMFNLNALANAKSGGFFKSLAGGLPGALNTGLGSALGSFGSGQTSQNLAAANYYNSKA
jgi:hypothetical protein